MDRIAASTSETEVRDLVTRINERIRQVNRTAAAGPPSSLMPLDVDSAVERWRERTG